MPYITNTELKSYLSISTTNDDALLQACADQATQAIEAFTKRQFNVLEDSTRYCDAVGYHIQGRSLFVYDLGDIYEVTTVVNGDGTTLLSSDFTLYPRTLTEQQPIVYEIRIKPTSAQYWTYDQDPDQAIAITGKWGYSGIVPASVKQAALRLASFYYRQKDSPLFDVTSVEAGVIVRPIGMPSDVQIILKPFVRL